jgi:glycosyltransferase involved in cell wall biosynthesis
LTSDRVFDVVMPLYNKEKFVAETIESVLAQSFPDWRLFVVDDGSTDRGADVVRGYGDPRITRAWARRAMRGSVQAKRNG